jgi:predicted extracellular nuclease
MVGLVASHILPDAAVLHQKLANEYRSSDHDPLIVELRLSGERICLPVVMRR